MPHLHRPARDGTRHLQRRQRAREHRHLRTAGPPGGVVMMRHGFLAVIAAAIIGVAGCGQAGADSEYHEHNETDSYTIDITYPLDYPEHSAVSDYVSADRAEFLDWV